MFKNTLKLISLLCLLILSFVYTDKVFSSARASDPLMQEVMGYKDKTDVKAVEPIIKEDELVLGYCGVSINEKESYKNMKDNDKFDNKKIVYDKALPKNTISKTYDYYIKQGNPKNNNVSIIFKVDSSDNLDSLLSWIAKTNIEANFFVDGAWLEENIETGFSIVNLGSHIYNLGYAGEYSKSSISITNNMVESITLKDSNYCLNENKNDEYKEICKKKNMHSITPTMVEPNISQLKENLVKGAIISFDVNNINISDLNLMVKTITSRGYNIKGLSEVVSEDINN